MSNINTSRHVAKITLGNGTTLNVNDHVYLVSDQEQGQAHRSIGRVMEFCTPPERKGLHVRIAWYDRMKNLGNHMSSDPKLLVATMHSDIQPVSAVRGKCTVIHKHYISNINAYRNKPNHLYYSQLCTRYNQHVYDVIPCDTVQNVPVNVLEALKSKYQFIVVDQGKATDLTMTRRTCRVCREWCSSTMSVKCFACQEIVHMSCVIPPLVRQLPRGFAWECGYCTRQKQVADDSNTESPNANATLRRRSSSSKVLSSKKSTSRQQATKELVGQMRVTRSQTRRQQQQQEAQSKATARKKGPLLVPPIKMTNMWPFRYFDENTSAADILDMNDSIYPRSKSCIGTKYQANVPGFIPPSRPSRQTPNGQDNMVPSLSRSSDLASRGTDESVTVVYQPGILSEPMVDQYMNRVKQLENISLPPYSLDMIDRALQELSLSNYDIDAAYKNVSKLNEGDFKHIVKWTPVEVKAFEQSIRKHGHDLNHAKAAVKTKDMADIVRYFYQWKKTDHYQSVYSKWTKVHRPLKKFNQLL